MTDKKVDPIESAEKIQAHVDNLATTLSKLTGTLSPLMDFGNIKKEINNLKNIVPKTEGETSETNVEERLADSMFELCKKYPNDAELGGKIRELYHYFNTPDEDS